MIEIVRVALIVVGIVCIISSVIVGMEIRKHRKWVEERHENLKNQINLRNSNGSKPSITNRSRR